MLPRVLKACPLDRLLELTLSEFYLEVRRQHNYHYCMHEEEDVAGVGDGGRQTWARLVTRRRGRSCCGRACAHTAH